MRYFSGLIVASAMLWHQGQPDALAQCNTGWEPGPLSAPLAGADGPIHAIWTWSLPGNPVQLIVGGDFTHIGGIEANNIAAWDGVRWHELAGGLNNPVYALTTYNTALVAGGNGAIATWNGSTWGYLGTPLPTFNGGQYPNVFALTVFNGELYAGGDFQYISDDLPGTSRLWRYTGSGGWPWQPVPAGTGSAVRALQVFDADGAGANPPALYVGGENGNLRKWDGTTATTIAGPYANTLNQPGDVYALTVVNPIGPMPGGLIVGGSFLFAPMPGGGGNMQVNDIARFDGTNWSAIAGGLSPDPGGYVSALRAFGADLYAAGEFGSAGGGSVTVNNIARFNGSQWFNPGNGTGTVYEMREFNGQLIVGGWFSGAGGGVIEARNIARWTGAVWSALAEPFSINALARIGSRIVMGGNFSHPTTTTAGPPITTNRYNISTWDTLNEGGLGWGTNGNVRALLGFSTGSGASQANLIVAGGDFTVCGPDMFGAAVAANRVAVWTESALTPAQWSPMGSGFNGPVNALERFNGWTVAAGSFTASGGTTTNRVAKYVGAPPSWQPLTSPDPAINGTVWALKAFSDGITGIWYLVMGGDFTAATPTGVAANRILLRRESPIVGESAYQALGAGFNNTVYAIERYGNGFNARTYAAGAFTASGAVTVNRIARLNGANWEPVGNGIGFNGAVYALKNIGGYLYAAGSFTSVDGIPANRVARWNGTAWSAPSGGTNDLVFALMGHQTEVIAGGVFVDAGGVFSPGLARLKNTGVPWIAVQPSSQTVECFGGSLLVTPAPGYEPLAYAWHKNGTPVADGPTPHGSIIFGSQTSNLSFASPQAADSGSYTCVVSNACGSVTSAAATLTITSCCPPDINNDGSVTVLDLLSVINAWGSCPSPCPPSCPADIANAPSGFNCSVDVLDLLRVINAWGPCP